MQRLFNKFAQATSRFAGHPFAFIGAAVLLVIWAITGPFFGYSDAWQLVINTGTTIVTFLMVFLIQNSQNRDSLSIQLKLTELVLASHGARNSLANIENLTDEELEILHQDSLRRANAACHVLEHRKRRIKPSTKPRQPKSRSQGNKKR
jgi:low affinity Fe/Cu permease